MDLLKKKLMGTAIQHGQVQEPPAGPILATLFDDQNNSSTPGDMVEVNIFVPAETTAVMFLCSQHFRQNATLYTPMAATLNGVAMTNLVDSNLTLNSRPSAHVLAITSSITPGNNLIAIDRPGTTRNGQVHTYVVCLKDVDTNLANWSTGIGISGNTTSMDAEVTTTANGSLVFAHGGVRRPGFTTGGVGFTALTLTDVTEGVTGDDTPDATNSTGNSLTSKVGYLTGVSNGTTLSCSMSWLTADRGAIASVAIPPAP